MAKEQLSTWVDHDLMEELRDAVAYLEEDSIRSFVERSIRNELRRARKRKKVGGRFPLRHGDDKHGGK